MEAVGVLALFIIGAVVGWRILIKQWEADIEPDYDPNALWMERLRELNRDQPPDQ